MIIIDEIIVYFITLESIIVIKSIVIFKIFLFNFKFFNYFFLISFNYINEINRIYSFKFKKILPVKL